MLLVDTPSSMRAYHISQILKQSLSTQHTHLSMQYALVQSVYLYNNASFTLSKITDNFQTLRDILSKSKQTQKGLDEKLLLYFVTEIIRIVSQLHSINMIHSNLTLCSFVAKFSEISLISGEWSDEFGANGWHNFGLLLHNIDNCIKLGDFIDANEKNNTFGCCIDQNNLQNNMLCCTFQKFVKNKVWCYEVDTFAIFAMIVQLLTPHIGGCDQVMQRIDFSKDMVSQIDAYRAEIGLEKVQNGNIWNELLQMMLMRENCEDEPYQFDKLSIWNRQNYLKQCYKHCAMQLMDLENLSPKLQVILARLDRMMRA